MPLSPETDRELVDLIATITDEGQVVRLAAFAEDYGSERCARVIRDDFAVVHHVQDGEDIHQTVDRVVFKGGFFSQEEALRQVAAAETSRDVLCQGPWSPIGLEDEPDLIFRYCADEPEAVAEIRRRNKERREAWEQQRTGS